MAQVDNESSILQANHSDYPSNGTFTQNAEFYFYVELVRAEWRHSALTNST